ncbi:phosphoribosyltransferase [Desulforamulus aeronauticus]|uniref:Predicted phosphoribosyltransferase n=1 Tax=Desulforamulus aeronauticus DSM 10349 TaxID=1121421 RepID=A0A1M6T9D9_9FIRM|nr:phosphoribosyltransferase family protein [Desulforamulus aeronauticus]SHK53595.1 Predicted phosphoribosyltransferase [Desulforamulus aeronauticus DSM 10349]
MFKNRLDAGQRLGETLKEINITEGIVLAIPRGGVVIGAQICQILGYQLDIIIPKKVGLPYQPEVAIGAVTEDGTAIYNQDLLKRFDITEHDLEPTVQNVIREIKRRMIVYRGTDKSLNLVKKDVILVDDGIATGATILAALKSLKNSGCRSITLAVAVAPPDTLARLRKEVDHLLCLLAEEPFYAVGQFYRDFDQVNDDEVIRLLQNAKCCVK